MTSTASAQPLTKNALEAMPLSPSISIRDAHLRYNDSEESVLSDLNMDFPSSQWTCILGRSGCGKSTLLRYLANLLDTKVQWSGQLSVSNNEKFT